MLLQAQESNSSAVTFEQRLEYAGVAVRQEGWHIWGTSPVIGSKGDVHLFVARWPVSAKFDPGWRTHSEVAHYVSDSPEGPFSFSDVALAGTGGETWDRCGIHNPAIHKVGKKYVLLYISNTGLEEHPANQRIGMAISNSLYGPWKKVGKDGMILAPPADRSYYNYKAGNGVVNPAFLQHPDGRFFLYFKSNDTRKSWRWHSRMGLAIAKNLEGPYVQLPDPITGNDQTIEDGYAFVMDRKVFLLTTDNHGILKRGGGLLWESKDGLQFENQPVSGFGLLEDYIPVKERSGARRHYGRGGKFERPQVLMIGKEPAYLYLASGTNIEGGSGTISYVLRVRPRSETAGRTRVACLGDSITFGARARNPKTDSYPAQLARMLGDEYVVNNYGIGGATLIKKGRPCIRQKVAEAVHFQPHIVIIMLGTNDTVSRNWKHIDDFSDNANELISLFRRLPTKPTIFFCSPTDMILETEGLTRERIDNLKERKPRLHELIPIIKDIAEQNRVEFLDMNRLLQGKPDLLTDGVHPNADEYRLLAEEFHKALIRVK
ncbi:MAG: GDSL-type esterase/lipase family protein [Planctomycetota bacterium]|nr:GDSL-type esterase/lipase family protein [Planctomycetota bacterium]